MKNDQKDIKNEYDPIHSEKLTHSRLKNLKKMPGAGRLCQGKLDGKVVTLNNGDKAWLDTAHDPDFPDDHSFYLDWYHDHLWYSLCLENENGEFTEQDIINVANSFRDLNISNK